MATCLRCNRSQRIQFYKCYYGRRYFAPGGDYDRHRWELLGSVEGPICDRCIAIRRTVLLSALIACVVTAVSVVLLIYGLDSSTLLLFGFFGVVILFSINADNAYLSLNAQDIGDRLVWSERKTDISSRDDKLQAWPRKQKALIFKR